jgi:hypothetical protein
MSRELMIDQSAGEKCAKITSIKRLLELFFSRIIRFLGLIVTLKSLEPLKFI